MASAVSSHISSGASFLASSQSKCSIVICTIVGVVGVVFIILGAMKIFGEVGTIGFIGSLAGGGVLALFAGFMICWIAVANYRQDALDEKLKIPVKREEAVEDLSEIVTNTTVIDELKQQIVTDSCSNALKAIDPSFFEHKSQRRAKAVFLMAMQELIGSKVDFPRAGPLENLDSLHGVLDQSVFRLSRTDGVQHDIPHSSKDKQHLHVYQVASQYNASEAPNVFTPSIGDAMNVSTGDKTQGPLAQRTNPIAFELVTAFLTHLGFNMLDNVLPSAGKTYENGSAIEHGYLRPTDETMTLLTDEFKQRFSQAEYVCYSSLPAAWAGVQPVRLFLQAAPAIGYAHFSAPSDELQKYAALANYLALFRKGIALARESGNPVVLHAAAVGGGVFGNQIKNLQWGFEKAALALQAEMKLTQVSVQLEAYQGTGPMKDIADNLHLPTKKRIGG